MVEYFVHKPQFSGTVRRFPDLYNTIGIEARDCLFRHMKTDDDALDVLARRWWANELLWFINRFEASESLFMILSSDSPDWREEDVLICFDMLMRRDGVANHAYISGMLDNLAKQFEAEHPKFAEFTTRDLAFKLVEYLMFSVGLRFSENEDEFFQPSNSLLSYCLAEPEHRGLPITHCTIYCAIARRLGLRSRILGLPGNVFLAIYAPDGKSVDHKQLPPTAKPDLLYLDLLRPGGWEVSEEFLIGRTRELVLASAEERQSLVQPMNPRTFAYRVGNNIVHCINHVLEVGTPVPEHGLHALPLQYSLSLFSFIDRVSGNFMHLNPMRPDDHAFNHPRIHYRNVAGYAEEYRPWDAVLLQELRNSHPFSIRPFHAYPVPQPPIITKRRGPASNALRFRVGQVFRHVRYNYIGVIIGWDTVCEQPPEWQFLQGIGTLERGGSQPFYSAVAEDGSFRYVAEENILIIKDRPNSSSYLDQMVGRFFLRWDPNNGMFVSNLKAEYPDD
jgi:F-box protein 21